MSERKWQNQYFGGNGVRLDLISCGHPGRMQTRARTEGTTTWNYDTGIKALGKLSSVSSPVTANHKPATPRAGSPPPHSRTIASGSDTIDSHVHENRYYSELRGSVDHCI